MVLVIRNHLSILLIKIAGITSPSFLQTVSQLRNFFLSMRIWILLTVPNHKLIENNISCVTIYPEYPYLVNNEKLKYFKIRSLKKKVKLIRFECAWILFLSPESLGSLNSTFVLCIDIFYLEIFHKGLCITGSPSGDQELYNFRTTLLSKEFNFGIKAVEKCFSI